MMYYFDIREDGALFTNKFGIELVSDEVARSEARSLAIEILRNFSMTAGRKTITVEVRRDEGNPIYAATLDLAGRWAHELARSEELVGTSLPEPCMLPDPGSDAVLQESVMAEGRIPSSAVVP